MKKNEILLKIIDSLMKQRERLISELGDINFNEPSWIEKKNTLNYEINQIDMVIDRRVSDCELTMN